MVLTNENVSRLEIQISVHAEAAFAVAVVGNPVSEASCQDTSCSDRSPMCQVTVQREFNVITPYRRWVLDAEVMPNEKLPAHTVFMSY